MKIQYEIWYLKSVTVLGPSSDYYARHGDSDQNDIMMWCFDSEHDSEEEAIEALVENQKSKFSNEKVKYQIIKTYTI